MSNYFLSEILHVGDIAFLVSDPSNLDHNLFPEWNGIPYKCI